MKIKNGIIFEKGYLAQGELAKCFSGKVWVQMLVHGGNEWNCPVCNVTFEPGCINNWHSHPGGQILLVTGGRGWYQEWGKEARELRPGDVVTIPENVKHWHGAAKDSWFTHLSIETNAQKGKSTWLEAVNIDDYNNLK